MNVLVSIIIPCYNQAQYLAETLDSVLAQTYPHWECIIVNDGSPDHTEEVAQKYCKQDARFAYYYKDNSGVSDTRNYGIKKSKGKYVLPLDADDIIAPTYLEKTTQCLYQNPQAKLVYTLVNFFGEKECLFDLPAYDYNSLISQNLIVCTCLFKKEDYDKTIGYNSNMIHGLEDWDFLISLLGPEDIVLRIDEVLFYYRIKSVSRSTGLDPKYRETRMQIVANHPDVYENQIDNFLEYLDYGVDYKQKYLQIRSSHAYRLGKLLLKPFSWIRRILGKRK